MKRCLALILSFALICAGGCAAAQTTPSDGNPVSLYYAAHSAEELTAEDAVKAEIRYLDTLSPWDFFHSYFAGPESENLISPFPPGTRVLDMLETGDSLTLKLSGEFFTLMGVEMTLACCCLANTVCSYLGRDAILVTDETESIHMELKPEQYLLSNNLQDQRPESFTIYFADSACRYLMAETRAATLSENETEAAYVMRKLMEGPESEQLNGIIPEGSRLLSVSSSDGLCTVNFSHEFYERRMDDTYGAYMTIYGIVNTLTGLDGIEAVSFLVEGAPVEHYGIFPLGQPVLRSTGCIGPVRTASGEVDVNIFVLGQEDHGAFAIPSRVKQTISQPLAQAVTTRILSYEPPQGFYNPIPFGTELLSISVSGSTCYVDVSDKFIPQDDTEQTEREAVWALVTSLTDLANISSVVLTIEGESGGLDYVDISEPLTKQSIQLD